MATEFKPTKEAIVGMIGTTEGFSAEAVKKQLDTRYKRATAVLAAFRAKHGIVIKKKGEVKRA